MTRWFALAALLVMTGCPTAEGPRAERGRNEPTKWLCRPDRADDPCRTADLTTTEIRPDGARVVVSFHPAEHPKVDCFYVYPTVDLDLVPGNHTDFTSVTKERSTTLAQAARFGEACAIWAPLYRQVTIGTYLQSHEEEEKKLAIAYSDIDRAFREYLASSDPARKIVLVGHSQGAEMVLRIIERFFDDDPALRARLLLALPIGGDVDVVSGTNFGTSKSVPPCTQPLQTGCLVAYRTYAASEKVEPSRWAPPKAHETVCVDPRALDHPDSHVLAGAIFPTSRGFVSMREEVTTPFVSYPAYYEAHCQRGADGFAYLAVSEPAKDARAHPFDLNDRRFRWGHLGLHVLDMQLPQRDLVDLVTRRASLLREEY